MLAIVAAAILIWFAGPAFGGTPGQWASIGPTRVTAAAIPPLGTYNAVGRLTTIAVHPTDSRIIYVGSAGQLGHEGCGVWKTTDGGKTWTPITDSLPTLSVGAIAIDPTAPNRVYIVTADEGLFRSDNAGLTWTHVHGDLRIRTNTNDGNRAVLLIDPTQPMVLYVTSDDGVLRSSNGGQDWSPSLDVGQATSLVMDPMNPQILYAGIFGKGIYKTVTGGVTGSASWTPQTQAPLPSNIPGLSVLLALSHPPAAASEIVYAVFPGSSVGDFDLFRTNDGGSWSKRSSCVSCAFITAMATDLVNWTNVYLGGPLLRVSSDGGDHFTQVPASENDRQPASPHGDYWKLLVDPTNTAIVYAGSDGGLFRSTDHGKEGTWAFTGEGISNVEMYSLALANTNSTRALSGTQDNGTILSTGNLVWNHIPPDQIEGGDGGGVAIDPTQSDRFYAVFDNRGTPEVSSNGGQTFVDFSAGLSDRSSCAIWNMTFHIQIHPSSPQTLVASCVRLWQKVSSADWAPIFAPSSQQVVRSAIDSSRDIYYAGTNRGRLFAGVSGAGWQQVFENPNPSLFVSDAHVDQTQPDVVFASFAPQTVVDRNCAAKAGTSRVYQLIRLAPLPSLSMSATDITGNLPPGLCVNALAIDPHLPHTLYAATNKGVYRGRTSSTGGLWVWNLYNNGLAAADVRDLEVHPVTGHLFAATFGRSAFEVELETVLPTNLVYQGDISADFHDLAHLAAVLTEQPSGLPVPNESVQFTLGSQGCSAMTDSVGAAACNITLAQTPGLYTVSASFAGGGSFQASSASTPFTITREETTLTYNGDTIVGNGNPAHMSGVLLEDGNAAVPLSGRTVSFTLGTGGNMQTCNGVTNASGIAACTIIVNQPFGAQPIAVSFAGDAFYLPSSASSSLFVPQPPTFTKSFADSEVQLFSGITRLSFTITNPNPISLMGIAFTDTLPPGLIVLPPDNGLMGSCDAGTITAVPGSNSISLSGATLTGGGSCTFSVLVNGAAIGLQNNVTSPITSTTGGGLTGSPASDTTSVDDLFFNWFFAS